MTHPRSLSARRAVLFSLVLAGAGSLTTGCHVWNRLWGKDSIDLSKADVKSMSVDIRKDRKTICPREQVQMAVFADAVLDGEKDKKSYETWAGKSGANKNDKLDFVDFAFHSEQGAFDKDGWFQPNANVLATTDKEFEIKTVFKKQPDKFSFTTKYKPDYQCIKGGGRDGQPGGGGDSGPSGGAGHDGQMGSDSQAGGSGTSGGPGGSGSDGSAGGAGPHIVAYATMVKTPYYDKLVAIKLTGDVDDFLLAPVDQPVVLRATGGAGGPGGAGGSGGRGGSGGSGNPGGQGGQGGQGGNGGKGGSGGAGGSVELIFDGAYADLASAIKADVSGGPGGDPGSAGHGGDGGGGGSGITPSGSTQAPQSGQRGGDGPSGAQGAAGQRGSDGHAAAHPGRVSDQFASLQGITLLEQDAPAAAPPPDAPPAKATPTKKKQAKGKQ
ncbi:MAG TPA: collagen-like protein [Polyangiaceae bacterium]|nr:collagen-like protein [Polyangiaceae bacterium]